MSRKRPNRDRAAIAASHKINKASDPEQWQLLYDFYLERLQRETIQKRKTGSLGKQYT